MRASTLRADLLLLVTAAIWGFAFVAQRIGMEHVGPFTFNVARFVVGGLSLLPVLWLMQHFKIGGTTQSVASGAPSQNKKLWQGGLVAGLLLFAGSSFQQVGLVYTTAAKAGFITGLYIVIVPLLGLFLRHKTGLQTWLGGILALVGLYLLSMTSDWTIAFGDFLQLCGAFCWAGHVLWIGWISPQVDSLKLSIIQFLFCALLSLGVALATETIAWSGLVAALIPILYAGVLSVSIAYTLQVVAQKDAPAAHAAIIMSLEAVFAAIGGFWLLHEDLSQRALIGCALMLAGMLASQIPMKAPSKPQRLPT